MGPIALFDKSFLQSLSVDESVWFGHYFMPVVCPLFYVETLADLHKQVRPGRTPEDEVRIIADKFPDQSAYPCAHHDSLILGELHGHPVPMTGQIPLARGRMVEKDGKRGVIYDESPEAKAFSRWQQGEFHDVERHVAKRWRENLASTDLTTVPNYLRRLNIDGTTCQSLSEAKRIADSVVQGADNHFARMALVLLLLQVPQQYHHSILEAWMVRGYPPLARYAPYVAYAATVELYFYLAIAAGLIGGKRASNRVDISYLYYLPFCMVFVSGDRLHRDSAPQFLRPNQEFVWGPDLKEDLRRVNEHFQQVPDEEKEKGLIAFASAAPALEGSIIRRLRAQFLRPGVDDPPREPQNKSPTDPELLRELQSWTKAPDVTTTQQPLDMEEPQMISIQRRVSKRKGSWWQLPKNLRADER